MTGGPAAPIPQLQMDERVEPPRASDERPVPPFIPPASVEPAAPLVAPATDPVLQAELARLRAAVDRAPPGAGRSAAAAEAAWQLGLAALHGIGTAVQPHEARQWFMRALQLGAPLAAAGLAWCAIDGCGGPPDPTAARRWIAALRPVDAARAQYLEWLLQTRLAPLRLAPGSRTTSQRPQVGEGAAEAGTTLPNASLLVAAARAGSVQAAIELGVDSAARGREQQALEQFRAVAPRSRAAAFNAELLAQRQATPQPAAAPSEAAQTFARAQRYHRGERQPANFTEAIRLYRLAQSQGSDRARRMLELIFSRPAPGGGIDIAWMQQLAHVNVPAGAGAPSIDSPGSVPLLRREPTPLSDLLPQRWSPAEGGIR